MEGMSQKAKKVTKEGRSQGRKGRKQVHKVTAPGLTKIASSRAFLCERFHLLLQRPEFTPQDGAGLSNRPPDYLARG